MREDSAQVVSLHVTVSHIQQHLRVSLAGLVALVVFVTNIDKYPTKIDAANLGIDFNAVCVFFILLVEGASKLSKPLSSCNGVSACGLHKNLILSLEFMDEKVFEPQENRVMHEFLIFT